MGVMLCVAVAIVGVVALVGNAMTRTSVAGDSTPTGHVTRVDPEYVCMVNNRSYPKPQIAVPVDGQTYYGCCEMCEGALRDSRKHRDSIDPVSGNPVDKAQAVIGALADGRVHYFENESNLRAFNASGSE